MSGEIPSQPQPDVRIQDSLRAHIYADGSKDKMDEHYADAKEAARLQEKSARALADAEIAGEQALADAAPFLDTSSREPAPLVVDFYDGEEEGAQLAVPEVVHDAERKPLDLELMQEIAEMPEERNIEQLITRAQSLLDECISTDPNASGLNDTDYRKISGAIENAKLCRGEDVSAKQVQNRRFDIVQNSIFPDYTHRQADKPGDLAKVQERLLMTIDNLTIALRRNFRAKGYKYYTIPKDAYFDTIARENIQYFNAQGFTPTSIKAEDDLLEHVEPAVVFEDASGLEVRTLGAFRTYRYRPGADPVESRATQLARPLDTVGLENQPIKNECLAQVMAIAVAEVRERNNLDRLTSDPFNKFAEKLCCFSELLSHCDGPLQVESFIRANFDQIYRTPDDLALTGQMKLEDDAEKTTQHLDLLWSLKKLRELIRVTLRASGVTSFQAEKWEYIEEKDARYYNIQGAFTSPLPAHADTSWVGIKGPTDVFQVAPISTRSIEFIKGKIASGEQERYKMPQWLVDKVSAPSDHEGTT